MKHLVLFSILVLVEHYPSVSNIQVYAVPIGAGGEVLEIDLIVLTVVL